MSERFYVREHAGYSSRGRKQLVELMLIDSHYCHELVQSWPHGSSGRDLDSSGRFASGYSAALDLTRRRVLAQTRCDELNAWHERLLAA